MSLGGRAGSAGATVQVRPRLQALRQRPKIGPPSVKPWPATSLAMSLWRSGRLSRRDRAGSAVASGLAPAAEDQAAEREAEARDIACDVALKVGPAQPARPCKFGRGFKPFASGRRSGRRA